MTKRAGLFDLTPAAPMRQASRDVDAVKLLAHIDEGIGALVAEQRKQTQILADMARMMWERTHAGT